MMVYGKPTGVIQKWVHNYTQAIIVEGSMYRPAFVISVFHYNYYTCTVRPLQYIKLFRLAPGQCFMQRAVMPSSGRVIALWDGHS